MSLLWIILKENTHIVQHTHTHTLMRRLFNLRHLMNLVDSMSKHCFLLRLNEAYFASFVFFSSRGPE